MLDIAGVMGCFQGGVSIPIFGYVCRFMLMGYWFDSCLGD